MTTRSKIFLAACGLVCLFSGGLAVRLAVLQAQYRFLGRPPPFTLESALEYRLVEMVFNEGGLPARDMAVQVPEGVVLRETYTIGAEYVYAFLARLLPRSFSLTDRVRVISAAWFSLGIVFMSAWLWFWLRSRFASFIGGSYYAVSLASVMRSTGQELSHENFAIPLLIAHLAANACATTRANGRAFWAATALSAVLLACAAATWDMIQFYLLLWTAAAFARLVRGRYFTEPRRRAAWLAHLLALVAAGVLNPYLRAHAFPASYAMLLGYGVALGLAMERCVEGRRLLKAAVALAPLAAGIFLLENYGQTYGHFLELLWAKVLFMNQKPSDPSLLTFAQRIMWTPALNSADLRLTRMLFPFILPLLFLSAPAVLLLAPRRSDPELENALFYFGASLPVFVLFMRFHVFLVIFAAALLGWLGSSAAGLCASAGPRCERPRLRWAGAALALFLALGVAAEAAHSLSSPVRWGRSLPYLAEQEELARWMSGHGAGAPVLANFALSPFLLVYAGCPIVLHPKFESPEIRNRVRAYGEALFTSGEEVFRAWADSCGAGFYVFALGEFSPVHPELQMRYFVDAMNPPPGSAALLFDKAPETARFFQYLWGNSKYRVFRVISSSDEREASRYAADAFEDFSRGDLDGAENKAVLALAYNPNDKQAMKILLRIESLGTKGAQ